MIFLAGSDPFLCPQPSCLPSVFNVSPTCLRAQNKKLSIIFYRLSSGSSCNTIKQRVSICFQFVRAEHISRISNKFCGIKHLPVWMMLSFPKWWSYSISSHRLQSIVAKFKLPNDTCLYFWKFRFHMRTMTELSNWQLTRCCYQQMSITIKSDKRFSHNEMITNNPCNPASSRWQFEIKITESRNWIRPGRPSSSRSH